MSIKNNTPSLLGEMGEVLMNNSLSRSQLDGQPTGKRVLHYGDIHTNLPSHIKSVMGFPTANTDALSYLSDKQRIQCGDVVLADASEDYNDVGKAVEFVGEPEEDTFAGLHTILFRPYAKNFAKGYLAYALQGWPMRLGIMRLSQGAKVLGLSKSYFQKLEIHPHDLEEQKKIAAFLSAVDEKLVAIEAQLAGWRDFKCGMMQALFTQTLRFKADDGDEFPDWRSSEFGVVVERNPRKVPSEITFDYPCVEMDCLVSDYGKVINVHELGNQKSNKSYFHAGDVLFGKLRPYLRKFAHPNFEGACSTEIWVLNGKGLRNDYLFQLVQTPLFIAASNKTSGSKMPRADWGIMKDFPIRVPSLPEQKKIADYLSALDTKIDALNDRFDATREFKRGLLQKMFV